MKNYKIVIIDQERVMLKLSERLGREGFVVSVSHPGKNISETASSIDELVRFDILLSEDSMGAALQMIHSFPTPPLFLFTARVDSTNRLFNLEIGVRNIIDRLFSSATVKDRYKPGSNNSSLSFEDEKLVAGPISIDFSALKVSVSDSEICLTPIEFNLLRLLALNPEKVVTRKELMAVLYGPGVEDRHRSVDCHIAHIRKKISRHLPHQSVIHTVYGTGYAFRVPKDDEL